MMFLFLSIITASATVLCESLLAESEHINQCFDTQYANSKNSLTADELQEYKSHFNRHMTDAMSMHKSLGLDITPLNIEQICGELFEDSRPAITDSMVNLINEKSGATWQAEKSERFEGMSLKDAKVLMGTFSAPSGNRLRYRDNFSINSDTLPKSFDGRKNWPHCASIIGHIRDQSNCGSCWAQATSGSLGDRFCIATDGKMQKLLSAQYTTSCCPTSDGCHGGNLENTWGWFEDEGLVSGGDYSKVDTGTTCYPYALPPHHHGEAFTDTPRCFISCTDKKYDVKLNNDKYYAKDIYSLKDPEEMMKDVVENGSFSTAFDVYEDFITYKSGIYTHTSGDILGGHAVKIIGYGEEEGTKYWLVVNSWNTNWGEHGTFRIKFGECGIDDESAVGGYPDTGHDEPDVQLVV